MGSVTAQYVIVILHLSVFLIFAKLHYVPLKQACNPMMKKSANSHMMIFSIIEVCTFWPELCTLANVWKVMCNSETFNRL